MLFDYSIIIITPASNKDCLKLLIPQVQNLKDFVDEYRLFINTDIADDILYIKKNARDDPDFIKIIDSLEFEEDEKTIYIKIDNNVVLLDLEENFKNFIEFRINHKEYYFIYGNILNNAVISYIHQQSGKLKSDNGIVKKHMLDMMGYKNPRFAIDLHEQVLAIKNLKYFYFEPIDITIDTSDNFVSWIGNNKSSLNCIYGKFVCVNYAFSTQKVLVDTTDILYRYSKFNLA